MSRLAALSALTLVTCGSVWLPAQELAIPPIPQLERLIPGAELKATLRLSAARLLPGETPLFSLLLENTGRTTIRIPPGAGLGNGIERRVFTASGDEVRSFLVCEGHRSVIPTTVSKLLPLVPRQSTVIAMPGSSCYELPPLPVGEYHFRATYRNYPDWPQNYDVYETGGAETWAGEIDTPPVTFTVAPFDADAAQSLIDVVESDADASEAIRLLGLNRTRGAVDALLDRFKRDALRRIAILEALAHIGESSTAERLAGAIEQFSSTDRLGWRSITAGYERNLRQLLQASRDCEGVALLLLSTATSATARIVEERCIDLRPRLEAMRDTALRPEPTSVASQVISQRAASARQLLAELERPSANPVPTSMAQGIKRQPEPARLPDYVTTILSSRGYDSDYYLAVAGVTRFGTGGTFRQLRDALENGSPLTRSKARVALVAMTFENEGQMDMTTAAFWDRWWLQNQRRSREQWARDALVRREPLVQSLDWNPNGGKWRAAEYLVSAHRGGAQTVRELATHRSWRVRLGAADALVPFNRRYAGQLMLRELQNRYLGACTTAGGSLAELTGQWHPFQCHEVAARAQVTALWTRDVSLLPSGQARTGQ